MARQLGADDAKKLLSYLNVLQPTEKLQQQIKKPIKNQLGET